jgi:hypothetical protein
MKGNFFRFTTLHRQHFSERGILRVNLPFRPKGRKVFPTVAAGAVFVYVISSVAVAAETPPSFQADPNVYKVIFEDQNFRIIKATWKPGSRDKAHSSTSAAIACYLTNCDIRVHTPDGKSRDFHPKAGFAHTQPIFSSHSAENIGSTECQALFVERK